MTYGDIMVVRDIHHDEVRMRALWPASNGRWQCVPEDNPQGRVRKLHPSDAIRVEPGNVEWVL